MATAKLDSKKKIAAARAGIWCPWSQVLCYACHGWEFNRGFGDVKVVPEGERQHYLDPRPGEDNEALGYCDKCGAAVWVREDVGLLQQVRQLVFDEDGVVSADLQQTGGMCSALCMKLKAPTKDGVTTLVLTAMDGPLYLGGYKGDDWDTGEDGPEISVEKDDVFQMGREIRRIAKEVL